MTSVACPLSETLQTLIDARLDTIDRMLLGRVPRADRLAIVREVEAQILEQLGGRDADRIDRDDVLAVLGRLDPPEAYLADEPFAEGGPPRPVDRPAAGPARRRTERLALASGVVGLCAAICGVSLPVAAFVLAELLASEPLLWVGWIGTAVLVLPAATTGLVLAARSRLGGNWAILGLVTSLLAIIIPGMLIALTFYFIYG